MGLLSLAVGIGIGYYLFGRKCRQAISELKDKTAEQFTQLTDGPYRDTARESRTQQSSLRQMDSGVAAQAEDAEIQRDRSQLSSMMQSLGFDRTA